MGYNHHTGDWSQTAGGWDLSGSNGMPEGYNQIMGNWDYMPEGYNQNMDMNMGESEGGDPSAWTTDPDICEQVYKGTLECQDLVQYGCRTLWKEMCPNTPPPMGNDQIAVHEACPELCIPDFDSSR